MIADSCQELCRAGMPFRPPILPNWNDSDHRNFRLEFPFGPSYYQFESRGASKSPRLRSPLPIFRFPAQLSLHHLKIELPPL